VAEKASNLNSQFRMFNAQISERFQTLRTGHSRTSVFQQAPGACQLISPSHSGGWPSMMSQKKMRPWLERGGGDHDDPELQADGGRPASAPYNSRQSECLVLIARGAGRGSPSQRYCGACGAPFAETEVATMAVAASDPDATDATRHRAVSPVEVAAASPRIVSAARFLPGQIVGQRSR
jgi:hypothetical protein